VLRATGYDRSIILERLIVAAERATSSHGQMFDRDGVVFEKPITPFPLLAHILATRRRISDRLQVIDFGGGLGSTYRQCRPFLSQFSRLRWSVVEQVHVAMAGRQRFQDENLEFHDNMIDAAADASPDVIVFSSVLQYLEDPYRVLDQAARLGSQAILIDRTPFSETSADAYAIQVVDEVIFPARLPFRVFGNDRLEDFLRGRYCKIGEFDAIDPNMTLGKIAVKFKGLAFTPAIDGSGRS
jgi:putative methyltransferase (TIGR04325 family)